MQSPILHGAQWIGLTETRPNTTLGAARSLRLESVPPAAPLAIFAHLKYKLYINGRFVNAGPAPFRRPLAYVDQYDVAPWLRRGRNTLFVLAHHVGSNVKYGLAGSPGILLTLQAGPQRLVSDDRWRVYDLHAWTRDTPRRNWAIEHMEELALDNPSFAVLEALAGEDYGKGSPPSAPPARLPPASSPTEVRPVEPDWCFEPRAVPLLRWTPEALDTVSHVFRTNTQVYNLQDTAVRLSHEHLEPAWDAERMDLLRRRPIVSLHRRKGEPGFGIVFDAGRICAGEAAFEIQTDSPATLDLAHAEDFRNGRPNVWRCGGQYVARYHLTPGRNRARFFHFTGFRYLYFVLKDFEGSLEIRQAMVHHSRADLAFQDRFQCGERATEAVYAIARRSLKTNTQSWTYDCNTREQGTYWGDGLWITETVGRLTGNFDHMKALCRQLPNEVAAHPVPSSALFDAGRPLYDYCLVPPEVMRRYAHCTGDVEAIRPLIPAAEAVVESFRGRKDSAGWIRLEGWDASEEARNGLLFLDHSGIGWHTQTTTGIDRRDVNAGIHLYYLQALDALASLYNLTGDSATPPARRVDTERSRLRSMLRRRFLIPENGLMRDAVPVDETEAAPSVSQITNALAVITGVLQGQAARQALRTVLDIERHPWVSQGTPYSYFLLADAAVTAQCAGEFLPFFVRAFLPMLQRGATTTWETFTGENHDSLNHAWSAVLPYLVHRGIAGIRPEAGQLTLSPDLSALDTLAVQAPLPHHAGTCRVAWTRTRPGRVMLHVSAPPAVPTRLLLGKQSLELRDGVFEGDVKTR